MSSRLSRSPQEIPSHSFHTFASFHDVRHNRGTMRDEEFELIEMSTGRMAALKKFVDEWNALVDEQMKALSASVIGTLNPDDTRTERGHDGEHVAKDRETGRYNVLDSWEDDEAEPPAT